MFIISLKGYDGARTMSGQYNDCAAIAKKNMSRGCLRAMCSSQLKFSNNTYLRNCLGIIKQIVNYFRKSNTAGLILKNKIKSDVSETKQTRLLKFCETRWVEHLNSLS